MLPLAVSRIAAVMMAPYMPAARRRRCAFAGDSGGAPPAAIPAMIVPSGGCTPWSANHGQAGPGRSCRPPGCFVVLGQRWLIIAGFLVTAAGMILLLAIGPGGGPQEGWWPRA